MGLEQLSVGSLDTDNSFVTNINIRDTYNNNNNNTSSNNNNNNNNNQTSSPIRGARKPLAMTNKKKTIMNNTTTSIITNNNNNNNNNTDEDSRFERLQTSWQKSIFGKEVKIGLESFLSELGEVLLLLFLF